MRYDKINDEDFMLDDEEVQLDVMMKRCTVGWKKYQTIRPNYQQNYQIIAKIRNPIMG